MYIEFPPIKDLIVQEMDQIRLPKMMCIEQKYDPFHIQDIPIHILRQMEERLSDNVHLFSGKKICITAGSRGIPDLDVIIRTICNKLKEWGAQPFVVPAMGSHGGATAQGQAQVLAGYGVTEKNTGAPVRSSMEVVQYGQMSDGTPLYCDKYAIESDGIVVLNKVKPHTDFRGQHESGMAKMILIGLAKHKGASMIHMRGFENFPRMLTEATETFIQKVPVAFGVGIVQNAYDHISKIEIATSDRLMQTDKELLIEAKKQVAGFKFDDVDVMVIDEIGKNISGYGFDPNVMGRSNSVRHGVTDPISIKRLVIRGLTAESCNNGSGIVAADITTRSCLNQINWSDTWVNFITATEIQGAKIPLYANNDQAALLLAVRCCSNIDRNQVKLARIRNTLCMQEIMISEALYESIKNRSDVVLKSKPFELQFDKEGNLIN